MLDFVATEFELNTGAELGSDVQITLAGGGEVRFRCQFRRVSELADLGEIVEMDGVAGALHAPLETVSAVRRGDAVTVQGHSYRIVGIEPHEMAGRVVLVVGL